MGRRPGTRRSAQNVLGVERDAGLELDVPVVRPSIEEFRNFEKFVTAMEERGVCDMGLVKVVPPPEWSWTMHPNAFQGSRQESEREIKPIKQFVSGRKGAFRLDLMDSKKRPVHDFRREAEKHDAKAPHVRRTLGKTLPLMRGVLVQRGDALRWRGKWASSGKALGKRNSLAFDYEVRQDVAESGAKLWVAEGTYECDEEDVTSPVRDRMEYVVVAHGDRSDAQHGRDRYHVEGHGESAEHGEYRVSGEFDAAEKSAVKLQLGERVLGVMWCEREFPNSDTAGERFAKPFDAEAETVALHERDLRVIEDSFWASMSSSSTPPIYGGDQCGTLFGDAKADSWNLNRLDTILRTGFGDRQAKGISTSMLYFGMWRAMFAYHTEDMELNSVNFVHYGAPKLWYGILPDHAQRFETLARAEFGDEANRCPEFLRHKNIMLSPALLKREKIPFVRGIQYPGEFMFTMPRCYHGGFNLGFNVAEAVNFATPRWLDFGRRARWCKCESWTFRLDVDDFVDTVRKANPKVLPTEPQLGERVWVSHSERASDPGSDNESVRTESACWHLCRLKRGRRGAPFMAVSIDRDECPVTELPFDPAEDKWKWPFKHEPGARSAKRRRQRADNMDEEDFDSARAIEDMRLRALRWDRLRASRKFRLVRRRAHMFLMVQRDPSILMRIVASGVLDRKRRVYQPPALLPAARLRKLEALRRSRRQRLEQRRAKTRLRRFDTTEELRGVAATLASCASLATAAAANVKPAAVAAAAAATAPEPKPVLGA